MSDNSSITREGDWAYEIAKDIRLKWMQTAFMQGNDMALPAGHLSDIAEALRQSDAIGYMRGHEAGEKASRAALAQRETLAGEAEGQDANGGLVHEHAADLSATPEVNSNSPSPLPDDKTAGMTVEEARALLDGLDKRKKPAMHVLACRKASQRCSSVENADKLIARADRIEAALLTLQSDRGDQ